MRKRLSIVLISSVALLLSTGCSSNKVDVTTNNSESSYNKTNKNSASFSVDVENCKEAYIVIKKVGEKYDWKMTEYKLNEMFAEKRVNEKTIFTTIKFFEGTLTFSNASEAKDLFNAVKKEFSSKTTSH